MRRDATWTIGRWVAVAILLSQVALTAAHLASDEGVWRAVTYEGVTFLTVVSLLVAAVRRPPIRPALLLTALGVGLWFAGDVTWDVLQHGLGEDPFPSIADAFYLAGYPAMAAAMFAFRRRRGRQRRSGELVALLEAGAAATALASIAWAVVAVPALRDSSLGTGGRAVSVAYPVGDILLVGLVLVLLVGTTRRPERTVLLLGLAMLGFFASDVAWGSAALTMDEVPVAANLGWLVSYTLITAAALLRERPSPAGDPVGSTGVPRLVLLGAAALTPSFVLVGELLLGGEPELLSATLFIVVGVGLLTLRLNASMRRAAGRAEDEHRQRLLLARFAATTTGGEVATELLDALREQLAPHARRLAVHHGDSSGRAVLVASWPPATRPLDAPLLPAADAGHAQPPDRAPGDESASGEGAGHTVPDEPTVLDGERGIIAFPLTRNGDDWTVLTVETSLPPERVIPQVADVCLTAQLAIGAIDTLEARAAGRASQRYETLIRHSAEGIVIVDPPTDRIRYATAAAARLLGVPADELPGRCLGEFVAPSHTPTYWELRTRLGHLAPADTVQVDVDLVPTDRPTFHADLHACNLAHDESVGGWTMTFRDVSVQRGLEAELRHQAFHDVLTGLPNRALFLERLAHALCRPDAATDVAVLSLDLDGFKEINDEHGHGVGDDVLALVARRLRSVLRTGDTVARLGGDEFAVLLEHVPGPDVPERLADKILEALSFPFLVGDRELHVGASVGIATAPVVHDSLRASALVELLQRQADLAMYDAKRSGRNRHATYHDGMRAEAKRRAELAAQLERAVDDGAIRLAYQPLVEIETGRIVAVEALARWEHPHLGDVPPDVFVPVAEETGLIVKLGDQLLERACREIAAWRASDSDAAGVGLGVNVSVRQLQDEGFAERVLRMLVRCGLPAADLTLEISETALVPGTDVAMANLERLRAAGVGVSIHDFGSGCSSLAHLAQLPVTELKIDRLLVGQLDGTADSAFVRAIIGTAAALGLTPVAVGVELPVQAWELQSLGCRHAQGYLFAPPQDPASLGLLGTGGRTALIDGGAAG